MARKKQNVDAFGKSWRPVDIPNLEKAIKLYERLNDLSTDFANSLSGSNNIMAQINEKSEIQEELQKTGVNIGKEQAQSVVQQLKAQEQLNNVTDKNNKTPLLNARQQISNYSSSKSSPTTISSFSDLTKNITGSWIDSKRIRSANKIINEETKTSLGNAKRRGTAYDAEEITEEINDRAGQRISKSGKNIDKFSTALNVLTDVINKAAKVFWDLFMDGAKKQAQMYEDTFTGISVRTGMTTSQYQSSQINTRNQLNDRNLNNNIAMSEVQKMWSSLSTIGMSEENMLANSIDAVLTKTIVPYLDTTSLSVNLLNERLDSNFIKQIRGINKANMEIAGNNYITEDLLNTIISQVQPLSDESIQNLTQGSAEMTILMNRLMSAEGGGLSKEQAMTFASQVFKQQKYSDQIMTSGSTYDKLSYINLLSKGININDSLQLNDTVASNIGTATELMRMLPGRNSTMNSLITNMAAGSSGMGMDFETSSAAEKVLSKGLTENDMVNMSNLTPGQWAKYYEGATEDYANDVNNTAKQLQEITMENTSTELAILEAKLGKWFDVLTTAVKSISTAIITSVVGQGIGALAGLGGTGLGAKGLGSLVAGGGGIAIGAFTAAAALAVTTVIANGIMNSKSKNMGKNTLYYERMGTFDKYRKTDANGNPIELSDAAMELYSNGEDYAGGKGWGGYFTDGFDVISEYKSNPLMGWGVSRQDRNMTSFNKTLNLLNSADLSTEDNAKATLAWLMIADASKVLEDIGKNSDWIKQAYMIYSSDDDAAYWVDWVRNSGTIPLPQMSTDAGKTMDYKYPTSFDHYHRMGLDSVPYDNYQAVLHEDEAVLTASTANELRNLVVEYRSMSKQSLNLDTIIQTQTISLCNKMDEIINTINRNSINLNSSGGDNVLDVAMRHLKSSKSFN